ncbi:flagellar basal body rod protein FlgB [Alkalibacillus aidingensis]|uniref:flagellar basal body rod protein FlgB n=1 Tax=Alkalibacillus aidingensis TaxID=2747607 RepID=UPI001660D2AA|nr:flagellar basal body rod protein FlgB [Alkalibacillus aidingensis]
MKLFDNTFQNLHRGLDYASVKNKTIADNIANVDTPNYKAKTATFKDHFNEASDRLEAKRTRPQHIPFSNGESSISVKARNDVTYNNNGNSVDLDKEMNELAQNQLYSEALTERINGKFNSIKTVTGGR